MQRRHIAFTIAVALVLLGAFLTAWTEPAGDEGGAASGGVAEVSEDTRPYFWAGLVVLVLGAAAGVYGATLARRPS